MGSRDVTLAVVTPPDATEALANVAGELPTMSTCSRSSARGPRRGHALYSERGRADPPVPRFGAADLARLAAAWS